jgi:hypothetical protein
MALERRNVPTATFLTNAFASYGVGLAKMQGMPELPTIVIEHPIAGRPSDELRDKVRGVHAQIVSALTGKSA